MHTVDELPAVIAQPCISNTALDGKLTKLIIGEKEVVASTFSVASYGPLTLTSTSSDSSSPVNVKEISGVGFPFSRDTVKYAGNSCFSFMCQYENMFCLNFMF